MGAKGLIAWGVPEQPFWLIFFKGAVLLLSLIVFCLGCYAASIASYGAPGFIIFINIMTWIFVAGGIGFEFGKPEWYLRIVMFSGYIFLIIFWLAAWAWSAAWGSAYYTWNAVLAACAGLGALIWCLLIVLFVFFTIACVKDPNSEQSGNVELGQGSKEQPGMQSTAMPQAQYGQQYPDQSQYPQQQPDQYPQQPYQNTQQPYQVQ